MEDQSQLLVDVHLEDKITNLWPEYPLPLGCTIAWLREMAYLEIAERLKESGKTNVANIHDLLEPYLFPYFFQHLNVTIISASDAWGE